MRHCCNLSYFVQLFSCHIKETHPTEVVLVQPELQIILNQSRRQSGVSDSDSFKLHVDDSVEYW